jgi:S-DNA-T family DNA segregation ATPase FtsK/SpoIIIE
MRRRLREAAFLLLLPLVVYLFACLASYNPQDSGWSHAGTGITRNIGGAVGAWSADLAFYLFGYLAYAFPLLVLIVGWNFVREPRDESGSTLEPTLRLVGGVAFFIGGTGLAYLHPGGGGGLPAGAGGIIGHVIGDLLMRGFGFLGATLFLLALFLVALTLATGLSWLRVMDAIGQALLTGFGLLGSGVRKAGDMRAARAARSERQVVRKVETVKQSKREPIKIEPVIAPIEKSERAHRETQIPLFAGASREGELPPLSLLDEPKPQVKGYSEETLEALSRQVEFKL